LQNPIVAALADVVVGLDESFERISVIPLFARGMRGSGDCLTLEDALASGKFRVTEVSDAGQVPELKVINRGKAHVLLLDGEELVGAKQNRIVNLTILVPPLATIGIPVSCVEAGRWNHRSRAFASSGNAQYARGRAHKVSQVTRSLASLGEARSDQRWIWDDIGAKSERLGADSETGAMSQMFDVHRQPVESYVRAFACVDGQVGAVFAIDGTVVGLDLFDAEDMLRRQFPKLLRSYALDAVDVGVGRMPARGGELRHAAEMFLRRLSGAAEKNTRTFPGVGVGESLRVEEGRLAAAALLAAGELRHLAAFDLAA
jgi:hypothetical protein